MSYTEAQQLMQQHGITSDRELRAYRVKNPACGLPCIPLKKWGSEWQGCHRFFNTIPRSKRIVFSLDDCRKVAIKENISSSKAWIAFASSYNEKSKTNERLPTNPPVHFSIALGIPLDWSIFFQGIVDLKEKKIEQLTHCRAKRLAKVLPIDSFEKHIEEAEKCKIKTRTGWREYVKNYNKNEAKKLGIQLTYKLTENFKDAGWEGWSYFWSR